MISVVAVRSSDAPTHATQEPRAPAERARTTYGMLDAWRALAALAVVIVHGYEPFLYPELAHSTGFAIGRWGALGVPIFFVISGYCITAASVSALRRTDGVRTFLLARLRRIYPPYWWTLLGCVLISLLMRALRAQGLPHTTFLATLPLAHQTPLFYFATLSLTQQPLHQTNILGIFWTLGYEVSFYLLVTLAMLLTLRARGKDLSRVLLNALHLLTLGTLLCDVLWPGRVPFPFDLWPQFGFGALLFDGLIARGESGARKIWQKPAYLLGACGLLVLAYATRTESWHPLAGDWSRTDQPDDPIHFGVAWSFVMLLAILHPLDARLCSFAPVKWLMSIGLFSYSLYLTHLLVLWPVLQGAARIFRGATLFPLALAVGVAACVGAARVFFQFAERPYMRRKPTATSPALSSATDVLNQATNKTVTQETATKETATQAASFAKGATNASTSRTYKLLDAFRGLASLGVVAAHGAIFSTGLPELPGLEDTTLLKFAKWGMFGVPLFFVISGYCIAAAAVGVLERGQSWHGVRGFLQARLRRIYPPYWAALGFLALAVLAMRALKAAHLPFFVELEATPFWMGGRKVSFATLSLLQVPLHTPLILNVTWSLSYELAFYVLVALGLAVAMRVARARRVALLLAILHALTIGTLLWRVLSSRALPFPLDLWAQFGVGVLVFEILSGATATARRRAAWLLGACGVLLLLIALRPWSSSGAQYQITDAHGRDPLMLGTLNAPIRSVVTFGFALLLLALHRFDAVLSRARLVRPLMSVGVFSYSLYLTHLIVIFPARQIGVQIFPGTERFIFVLLWQVLVAIAVARVFYIVAERPFLQRKTARVPAATSGATGESGAVAAPLR